MFIYVPNSVLQGSNNVGVAVGVSISVVVVILIVIVVIVIGIYKYSKKRGYFSFKDRMTYKTVPQCLYRLHYVTWFVDRMMTVSY